MLVSVNELRRLNTGQLREKYADVFGELTSSRNRTHTGHATFLRRWSLLQERVGSSNTSRYFVTRSPTVILVAVAPRRWGGLVDPRHRDRVGGRAPPRLRRRLAAYPQVVAGSAHEPPQFWQPLGGSVSVRHYIFFSFPREASVMTSRGASRSSEWTGGGVRIAGAGTLTRLLLVSGILSSLVYAAMLVFVPMRWAGYSSASQTVSELSAIGAPSRSLWVSLGVLWTLLYIAFGWGVWRSASGNRALYAVGTAIIAAGIFGLFWPPMHQREVLAAGGATLTDTLHIVWTVVNGILTLLAMGLGAAALGKRFRVYSIATILVLLAAGVLTSLAAPGVNANLPTPWIGIWERINVGAWLLWVVVLAVMLIRSAPHLRRRLPEVSDLVDHPRAVKHRAKEES
jgi:hypothetical protein